MCCKFHTIFDLFEKKSSQRNIISSLHQDKAGNSNGKIGSADPNLAGYSIFSKVEEISSGKGQLENHSNFKEEGSSGGQGMRSYQNTQNTQEENILILDGIKKSKEFELPSPSMESHSEVKIKESQYTKEIPFKPENYEEKVNRDTQHKSKQAEEIRILKKPQSKDVKERNEIEQPSKQEESSSDMNQQDIPKFEIREKSKPNFKKGNIPFSKEEPITPDKLAKWKAKKKWKALDTWIEKEKRYSQMNQYSDLSESSASRVESFISPNKPNPNLIVESSFQKKENQEDLHSSVNEIQTKEKIRSSHEESIPSPSATEIFKPLNEELETKGKKTENFSDSKTHIPADSFGNITRGSPEKDLILGQNNPLDGKKKESQTNKSPLVLDDIQHVAENSNQNSNSLLNQKGPLPSSNSESPFHRKKAGELFQVEKNESYKDEKTDKTGKEPNDSDIKTVEDKLNISNKKVGKSKHIKKLKYMPTPSPESSKEIVTAEEKYLLDLIEMRKPPEKMKLICYSPMKFKADYEKQARLLSSEFQKSKEDFQSKTSNKSPIMKYFQIEQNIKDKMQKKIEKLMTIKHKTSEFKHQHLRDYSNSMVQKFFEMWGKKNVLLWEKRNLDIGLMSRLALVLNLQDKNLHARILPIFHGTQLYQRFVELHRKNQLNKVIDSIYIILGKEEGTRRLEAFCHYLQRHIISFNWLGLKLSWLPTLSLDVIQRFFRLNHFERCFGVSEYTHSVFNIPTLPFDTFLTRGINLESMETKSDLIKIYGNDEAEKKLEVMKYILACPYKPEWWRSVGLESSIKEFGLDPLIILKIGNSLQFGSMYFVENSENTIPPEEAYSTIIDIMISRRNFPWIESPERAWLYKFCGSFYQDRLRELSHLVFSKHVNMQTEIKNSCGFELIWCDLGLDIELMPNILELGENFNIAEEMKKYEKIYGVFSKYTKMAISVWVRSFSSKPQRSLGKIKKIQAFPLWEDKEIKKINEVFYPTEINWSQSLTNICNLVALQKM
jgi:hypothetical protein